MRRKIYLSLLIAIFSEAIMAFPESNEGSSNLLFRKRRIIDQTYQRRNITLRDVPYMVNVRTGKFAHCGGSILSPNIILTAAHCVFNQSRLIYVLSGSENRDNGYRHVVKHLQMHPSFDRNRNRVDEDIALLYIEPAINLVRSSNRKIQFYNGPLHPGIIGTISGWGCTNVATDVTAFPRNLQSTEVPLISSEQCHQFHNKVSASGEKHVCTFQREGKRGACFGDGGTPLVIEGKLAGILSGYPVDEEQLPVKNRPDFYVNLAYPTHRNWITSTILHLERIGSGPSTYRSHEPRLHLH